ncbi:MAG: cytochrome b5 domain-containing protein [Eubacteriales bacterium]
MKIRILAVLAAIIILFSLASCGKSSTGTTTATQTTTTITSVENTSVAQTTTAADAITVAITTTAVQTQASTMQSTTAAPTTKAQTTKAPTTAVPTTAKVKTFTKAELSKFDGKNGNKGYIAYDGMVYDVTNSNSWNNGNHHNLLYAGNDLTAQVNSCSQHLIDFIKIQLSTYPTVGTYIG